MPEPLNYATPPKRPSPVLRRFDPTVEVLGSVTATWWIAFFLLGHEVAYRIMPELSWYSRAAWFVINRPGLAGVFGIGGTLPVMIGAMLHPVRRLWWYQLYLILTAIPILLVITCAGLLTVTESGFDPLTDESFRTRLFVLTLGNPALILLVGRGCAPNVSIVGSD